MLLATVGPEPHVGAGPVRVVHGMHLDHIRAQVRQYPAGERPGDTESEVEHSDTPQGVRKVGARLRTGNRRGCGRRVGLGQDLSRMFA